MATVTEVILSSLSTGRERRAFDSISNCIHQNNEKLNKPLEVEKDILPIVVEKTFEFFPELTAKNRLILISKFMSCVVRLAAYWEQFSGEV